MWHTAIKFCGVTAMALTLFSCHGSSSFSPPELKDQLTVGKALYQDIPQTVPGYGLALSSHEFEISVEAEDTPLVRPGEQAVITAVPAGDQPTKLPCQVTRIARNVSSETHQGIAWLKPLAESHFSSGDFIFATITAKNLRHVLAVPSSAVFVKDGKSFVVVQKSDKDGKLIRLAQQVELGIQTPSLTEIKSGIEPNSEIITQGGLGFLYPDFKSADGD